VIAYQCCQTLSASQLITTTDNSAPKEVPLGGGQAAPGEGFRVQGSGCGVHGSRFGVWGIGFGGLGMRVQVSGLMGYARQGARAEDRTPDIVTVYRAFVQGLGFRVWGSGFRV